jgi:hypothetical protein
MDKRYLFAFAMGAASLGLGIFVVRLLGLGSGVPPVPPLPPESLDPPKAVRTQNISGPYTHQNLTVYLVHGEDRLDRPAPITLEEAMKREIVVVHETGDVDELEIENVSSSEEVYVQAGDIVKGGKQDRVLTVDLIVPARSGRIPISSFCVEHGRWTARGTESTTSFKSADNMVTSKDLKLAAKHSSSQAEVWDKVEEAQTKLSAASNTNVTSDVSRSSLPLTLENENVRSGSEDYVRALRSIIAGKDDVIGFVFAINGEINSGDTYSSRELFKKMWPKLIKAAAIEAVAESYGRESSDQVAAAEVESFLSDADRAERVSTRDVTDRITMVTHESTDVVLIESRDAEARTWLHKNYLMR